jgi:hypothetical protein
MRDTCNDKRILILDIALVIIRIVERQGVVSGFLWNGDNFQAQIILGYEFER